jgi:hypothetical protein
VKQRYSSNRLSFSLRTKSNSGALRAAQSVTQRLENYWLGLRLQDMDIPAIHLVKVNHEDDSSPVMLDAVENYLRIKCDDDRIFIRTAQRNGNYVAKLLGNRPITSYSTSEAAQFRDWCLGKGMNINSVKRVFASVRSIINLNIREYGLDGSNAFSGTYMPDRLAACGGGGGPVVTTTSINNAIFDSTTGASSVTALSALTNTSTSTTNTATLTYSGNTITKAVVVGPQKVLAINMGKGTTSRLLIRG